MTRGGKRKDRSGPERRCIVTGDSLPSRGLIRFVLSPDGIVVPDLSGRLPGRGAWLTADREIMAQALKKNAFSRAFRTKVTVDDALDDRLEALLARRLIDALSLARKAGHAVTGAEKVRARITSGNAAVLVQASDGAPDGMRRLAALADAFSSGQIRQIQVLRSVELGLAFGRDFAIHAALDAGGFADRAIADAMRLSGFRPGTVAGTQPGTGRADGILQNDEGAVQGARNKDDQ